MFGIGLIEIGVVAVVTAVAVWVHRRQITLHGLRNALGMFLIVVGVLIMLFGVLWATVSPTSIDIAIRKSRDLETTFRRASSYCDHFNRKNGRLPSPEEFNTWVETRGEFMLRVHDTYFPPEAIEKLGTPVPGSYMLSKWRGESYAYYASWSGKSTLDFDPKAYYEFGGPWQDFAAFAAAGIAVWATGVLMRPRAQLITATCLHASVRPN